MSNDFENALNTFLTGAQAICDDYESQSGSLAFGRTLTMKKGKRYVKIINTPKLGAHNRSVWAFIDTNNGDVLKPASWKAPAKHARGNIFDAFNGLKMVDAYGPAYLK
jgi:hypothetical protein